MVELQTGTRGSGRLHDERGIMETSSLGHLQEFHSVGTLPASPPLLLVLASGPRMRTEGWREFDLTWKGHKIGFGASGFLCYGMARSCSHVSGCSVQVRAVVFCILFYSIMKDWSQELDGKSWAKKRIVLRPGKDIQAQALAT